jgi:hypothetical protein
MTQHAPLCYAAAGPQQCTTHMTRSNSTLTCGDDCDGDLAVHRGVYEGSEYDVCVRVNCFVDDLRGRVDLYHTEKRQQDKVLAHAGSHS